MPPMHTSPYTAQQAGLPGASYTISSDDGSIVRLATAAFRSASIERMDSGDSQSISTRNVQPATEEETFGLELSQHSNTNTQSAPPLDNEAKLTPYPHEKTESSLPAPPVSGTSNHIDRSNPLNEPPILIACRYNRITLSNQFRWDLCMAAKEGCEKVVEQLLTALGRLPEGKKIDGFIMAVINAADMWGSTPLHLAANEGHSKVVEQLLEAVDSELVRLPEGKRPGGGSIIAFFNATDMWEKNPLHLAASRGHDEVVEQLLVAVDSALRRLPEGKRLGGSIMAFINAADWSGKTPLHLAAWRGRNKVVEQLLKAVDRLPESIRPAVVRRLLNATDDNGQTPLQLASQQNHHKVVFLLRDALQKLPQTARLDTIMPEVFDQPGSGKLPAAQPSTLNESSEVSKQTSLILDTPELEATPTATYVTPPSSYDEIQSAGLVNPTAPAEKNVKPMYPLHSVVKIKSGGHHWPISIKEMDINAIDMDGLVPLNLNSSVGSFD